MLRPTCVGTHLRQLSEEEEVNYNEDTDEWTFDESDGKEVTVSVTMPGIPSDWPPERVASWVYGCLGHPIDSAYEAFVRTSVVSEKPHGTEPREGNGCMIYGKAAEEGQ